MAKVGKSRVLTVEEQVRLINFDNVKYRDQYPEVWKCYIFWIELMVGVLHKDERSEVLPSHIRGDIMQIVIKKVNESGNGEYCHYTYDPETRIVKAIKGKRK